jgi:hypothetical protein
MSITYPVFHLIDHVHSLNKLRATYAKTHPNKEFKEPASYSRVNITSGVSLMRAAPSRTLVDRLNQLRQQFVDLGCLWLWEAANAVFAATANEFGAEHYSQSEKEAALRLPSLLGPHAYPTRPGTLPPATQSYTKLRNVLARAPSSSDELDSHEDHFEGETTYFWKEEYMAELFNALIAVIHEHGIEGVGWKSARWEVYDTVCAANSRIDLLIMKRFYLAHPLHSAVILLES